MLAAIIVVATSGCTWSQLQPSFGLSGVTAFRRFTGWTEARMWAKLHCLVPYELGARGELDWSRCAIDSVSVRALHPNVDRRGLPCQSALPANLHDSQVLNSLVRRIPPIRSRRGPRRRRPGKLHGDKSYDYRHLRRWLASRGNRHCLAHRGIE